ncbi:MAG TPA: uracil-DNA glycosylase [Chloroflexota bacterium]
MSASDAAPRLEDLRREVNTCTRCDLYRDTSHGVPGEGPANAEIMLVGEAPGRNEDRQGQPFVGAAGKFLEELLHTAGLSRDEVYITNVVKHWPHTMTGEYPQNRAPEQDELAACRPYLERQIELINPRLIIMAGRFSLGTFFPGTSISRVHGQIFESQGRHFFAMYHPAAALHKSDLRQTLLDDMKKLATFLHEVPQEREQPEVPPTDSAEHGPSQLSLFDS